MYAVSELFLRTLRVSHAVALRVDAYRAGELIAENLPISGGAVRVDGSSRVRRTLSVTISDANLAPSTDPASTLSPFGTELFVRRGIRYINGQVEWCPLGWFRIESARVTTSSAVELTGSDRGVYVQDARFTAATASNTSNRIPAEIERLIVDALPSAVVIDRTGSTARTPSIAWEEDRWAAIDELAAAIGAVVYFDADGQAIIEPVSSIDDAPAWLVDAGETGVLVEAETSTTREGTYNAVRASGEPVGDVAPVSAFVVDDDPNSPTFYDGPFGRKPHLYVSPLITTSAQAQSAARAMLDRVRGLSRQLSLTTVPNPALECGDVITVRLPDSSVETHLVDGFDIPLDSTSGMSLSTRSPDTEAE